MVTLFITLTGSLGELVGGRGSVVRQVPEPTTVMDAVEALGIPHCEVGTVTMDGMVVDPDLLITAEANLTVAPAAPRDMAEPRFLCDQHLGKLVRLLRFCGFDTTWDPSWREPALARRAVREDRTLLSRHRALLKRRAVTSALLVRSNQADAQLAEVLRRFRLADRIAGHGRCATCNGELAATPRPDVPVPIPPRTAAWLDDYWLCRTCGKLFWEGTHVQRLRERVDRIVEGLT